MNESLPSSKLLYNDDDDDDDDDDDEKRRRRTLKMRERNVQCFFFSLSPSS